MKLPEFVITIFFFQNEIVQLGKKYNFISSKEAEPQYFLEKTQR